jgi:integrase
VFTTGERPKNVLSWDWRDIGEDTVHIRRPKDPSKERTIPIARQLTEALGELRDMALRIADLDPVFCLDDGHRRTSTWYRKRFEHMMEELDLPRNDPEGNPRTFYSLKRSLITHLIDSGADEVLVREYVGHSHGYGETRVLTPVQSRYKSRQTERLRELVPSIEALLPQVALRGA